MQQRTAATYISRLPAAAHETTFGYLMPHAHLAQRNPPIEHYEQLMRKQLRNGLSLQDTAATLATGPRSLQRRCHDVQGKSLLVNFQDLRVERAQSLPQGSGLDIDAIATEVGYADDATLRKPLPQRLVQGGGIFVQICCAGYGSHGGMHVV